jgi:DNA-binding NarL/FixJ family response regulator
MAGILLCVAEPVEAEGLEQILRQVDGFELLPGCNGVAPLMAAIASGARPDVVLLDLTPEVTFTAMSELKQAAANARIVLWVASASAELAFQAMGLGIRGILRKQLPAALQVKCLQRVLEGELWFEKTLADCYWGERRAVLSGREGEVVSLLAQGLNNREIAATMMVPEGAVKGYLSRLFEKTGVKDRFELALFGLKNLTTQLSQAEEETSTGTRPGYEEMLGEFDQEVRKGSIYAY